MISQKNLSIALTWRERSLRTWQYRGGSRICLGGCADPSEGINIPLCLIFQKNAWNSENLSFVNLPMKNFKNTESINSIQSWSATWPTIWLQLTSFARPRCETPHRLQCTWTLYTIYWFEVGFSGTLTQLFLRSRRLLDEEGSCASENSSQNTL